MSTLAIGSQLPAFTAQTNHGEINSQELVGTPFVLYFYPRDSTPGCTNEARDFQANLPAFEKLGVKIIGVSRDSIKSHERFAERQELTFALISDPVDTVCNLFSVIKVKISGGVRGSIQCRERFAERQALTFALISDPEETVCNLFSVIKDKNMYGRKVRGIERSTFLFNAKGELVQQWRKVRVPGHVEAVLEAAQAL